MSEDHLKKREEKLPTVKLPYVPPKLVELGTVADITRAVGKSGSTDNAAMGATLNRTSV